MAKYGLFEFFGNGAGNHFQLKHDVIFQVESGGAHGGQWVALEPCSIFFGAFEPNLQLALNFVEVLKEAIWSCRGSLASAQIKYLKEHDGSILPAVERKYNFSSVYSLDD